MRRTSEIVPSSTLGKVADQRPVGSGHGPGNVEFGMASSKANQNSCCGIATTNRRDAASDIEITRKRDVLRYRDGLVPDVIQPLGRNLRIFHPEGLGRPRISCRNNIGREQIEDSKGELPTTGPALCPPRLHARRPPSPSPSEGEDANVRVRGLCQPAGESAVHARYLRRGVLTNGLAGPSETSGLASIRRPSATSRSRHLRLRRRDVSQRLRAQRLPGLRTEAPVALPPVPPLGPP